MPKLNVQQTNQNVIQAFKNALAIGNLKGIIASDGSHNFSTAGSNRNLLDNPWFTVRQRGDGPFSANTPAVDRWRTTSNATITATANGITLTTTVRTWGMAQRVEKGFFTVGKTYTISAMEQDGTITSASFEWTGGAISRYVSGANVGFEIAVSSNAYEQIYITTNYTGDVYLKAVKLELGSVSTLANDAPPDYGEELRKCMRYFVRFRGDPIGIGYISSNLTNVYLHITTGVQMAKVPTASLNGAIQVRGASGTIGVSSISVYNQLPTEGANVVLSLSSQSSTTSVCTAYFNVVTNYIDLSADL